MKVCPNIKRVIGSGFFYQTIIEDVEGKLWEGWFDSWSKKTIWRRIQ